MSVIAALKNVRTALYVPASNSRAMEKARGLAADMVILDLEDAVPEESKAEARRNAITETATGFAGKLVALRLNATDSRYFADDVAAAMASQVDVYVLPKVESAEGLAAVQLPKPMLCMIETPLGIYNARDIAARDMVVGLIAGMNDYCAETGIQPGPERQGLELALQSIVLAAAAAGKAVFDGVNNQLDDMAGFERECGQGRCYGFTGKTVIHPNQIAIANAAFGPSETELAAAHELIAAASGGAQRFQGRMIESMHVEQAKRTIERATGKAG